MWTCRSTLSLSTCVTVGGLIWLSMVRQSMPLSHLVICATMQVNKRTFPTLSVRRGKVLSLLLLEIFNEEKKFVHPTVTKKCLRCTRGMGSFQRIMNLETTWLCRWHWGSHAPTLLRSLSFLKQRERQSYWTKILISSQERGGCTPNSPLNTDQLQAKRLCLFSGWWLLRVLLSYYWRQLTLFPRPFLN